MITQEGSPSLAGWHQQGRSALPGSQSLHILRVEVDSGTLHSKVCRQRYAQAVSHRLAYRKADWVSVRIIHLSRGVSLPVCLTARRSVAHQRASSWNSTATSHVVEGAPGGICVSELSAPSQSRAGDNHDRHCGTACLRALL